MCYYIKVSNYGEVEHKLQACMSKYRIHTSYIKDDKAQDARELFQCPLTVAISALRVAIKGVEIMDVWIASDKNNYEFN